MKYKHTRKEIVNRTHIQIWEECSKDDLIEILYQTNLDLLAQKEYKKEKWNENVEKCCACRGKGYLKDYINNSRRNCPRCNGTKTELTQKT